MSDDKEPVLDRSYFARIPQWPEFAISGDKVSGRVPVTKITSWRGLPELLEN